MIADSHFCHTHFAPACIYTTRHMFKVIVIEKDPLQIVDDHIDGPVGCIPHLPIIGTPRCGNADMDMSLFKMGNANLCLLGNSLVDHMGPVLFHGSGEFLESRQWLRNHQADNTMIISLGDRYCTDGSFGSRAKVNHIIHNADDMAAQLQGLLIRLVQHLKGNLPVYGKILLKPLQSLMQIDKHGYSPPLLRLHPDTSLRPPDPQDKQP